MPATTEIKEHMEVLGADGSHVGTVDEFDENGRIKLTRSDSIDGVHHFIAANLVDHVDEQVHLSVSAEEAMAEWEDDEEDEDDDALDLETEDDDSAGIASLDEDDDDSTGR